MDESLPREHFIPIRKADLVALILKQPAWNPAARDQFQAFCRLLAATIHFEFHERLDELKDAYASFDPDRVTRSLAELSETQLDRDCAALFERFVALLERGNFRRLSQADIVEALQGASEWGLNLEVDFDVFERLEIFARGETTGTRTRQRWRGWRPSIEVPIPVYQRLVVILRLRKGTKIAHLVDTDSVYIKVFKDIPKLDLEMLLPGTRVKLSLMDRGRIVLPTLSGVLLTGWKLLQGAISFAISGLYGLLAFLGLVGGTIGYGLRSFYGYMQTKQKYQLSLTQSLYYQNLDNNEGALCRLLDEAEEQEFREAVLAYYFLLTKAGQEGWTRETLDGAIEEFLRDAVGIDVDFEIGDAMEKLERMQLVQSTRDGRWKAVPLSQALVSLDRQWDAAFPYHAPSAEPGALFRNVAKAG